MRGFIAGVATLAAMAGGGALSWATAQSQLDADAALVADAVCGEARGESWEGQLAVAYVIDNRRRDPAFPSELRAVVLQPNQFAAIGTAVEGECRRDRAAWRNAYRAAQVALSDGELNHGGVFFDNCATAPGWMRRLELVQRNGGHCFYARPQ